MSTPRPRSNAETPDDANSMIGRWVAFLAAPLITLVSGFVALKANAWFDMNLTTAEVASYVGGIVLAIGTAIGVWLHNRGKYEIAKTVGLSAEQVGAITAMIESHLPATPAPPAGTTRPASITTEQPPPGG